MMFKVNGALILSLMLKRCWGIYDFARETGLHVRTCRKLLDSSVVTLKVIGTAAQAFGVNGNDLILEKEK